MALISDTSANAIVEVFGRGKALIGMIHVPPLPGSPRYRGQPMAGIIDFCLKDADALVANGMHGLMVENHGDVPFRKPCNIGHETSACLAVITDRLVQAFAVPYGISILANAAIPAFAVLLEGALVLTPAEGSEVLLQPGDAVRIEPMARGTWRLGNPGAVDALFAVIPMPPPPSGEPSEG